MELVYKSYNLPQDSQTDIQHLLQTIHRLQIQNHKLEQQVKLQQKRIEDLETRFETRLDRLEKYVNCFVPNAVKALKEVLCAEIVDCSKG